MTMRNVFLWSDTCDNFAKLMNKRIRQQGKDWMIRFPQGVDQLSQLSSLNEADRRLRQAIRDAGDQLAPGDDHR